MDRLDILVIFILLVDAILVNKVFGHQLRPLRPLTIKTPTCTISNYEVTGISRRMVKRHSLSNFAFPIISPCPGGRCRFAAPWLPNKFADENGKLTTFGKSTEGQSLSNKKDGLCKGKECGHTCGLTPFGVKYCTLDGSCVLLPKVPKCKGKKIVPTLKIKFARPLFHKHEDGREEDGKGPIVKMSEGNIDPKILNGRSLETKRSTRPFKIVCHKHVAVNPNRRNILGHFRIGTLPYGSIRRNTCGSGFNCIWDKFIFRIHPNPSNPWNPNPLNPLNSNPLSPFNPNPLNPNPFNHGVRVYNSNAGIELDEIVLEWDRLQDNRCRGKKCGDVCGLNPFGVRYCNGNNGSLSCNLMPTRPSCTVAINGGWTSWGGYSSCTKTCGTGYQTRRRTCTNPAPSGGGWGCLGSSIESRSCNTNTCPSPNIIDCKSPYNEIINPGIIITTPNHPGNYENNKICQVKIRFSGRVRIRFEKFDVETASSCRYDFLEVRDGDSSTSNLIGSKLCGNTIPNPIESSTSSMTLIFHTDGSVVRSGFKIVTELAPPRPTPTCRTQSGYSILNNPDPKARCIFPFTYNGRTYSGCTTTGHDSKWCATWLYNGEFISRYWGKCSLGCP